MAYALYPAVEAGAAVLLIVGADHGTYADLHRSFEVGVAAQLDLAEKNMFFFVFCWIVDFPMYEWNEDEGQLIFPTTRFLCLKVVSKRCLTKTPSMSWRINMILFATLKVELSAVLFEIIHRI